jgi:hypothetical protein
VRKKASGDVERAPAIRTLPQNQCKEFAFAKRV